MLRGSAGLFALAMGVLYLGDPGVLAILRYSASPLLFAGGAALAIGFLTPFAGTILALGLLTIATGWIPIPATNLHDFRLLACMAAVVSIAVSLLGPGAYSVDGRLFGRREIVIPPSPRRPLP